MSSNIKFDIFISYCWDNKKEVHELCDSLKNKGLKLWMDKEQMLNGNIDEIMKRGIKESKFFMCCATTSYCKRDNTMLEFNYATAIGKTIIYVTFEKFNSPKDRLDQLDKIALRMAKQLYFKNDNIDGILESFHDLNKVNKYLNKFITAI
jgi:hypothetical protein